MADAFGSPTQMTGFTNSPTLLSASNPTYTTSAGTFKYDPNTQMTNFFPSTGSTSTSSSTTSSSSVPVTTGATTYLPSYYNPTSGQQPSYSQPTSKAYTAKAPTYYAPPAAPDYSNLQQLQKSTQVQTHKSIQQAMSDYDALYASTQAQGFQAADNAGTTYANKLMQSGVNPSSAGVVSAQAKLPVYSALGAINTQKDQTRLDAVNKADTLAAQIASTIGNLQQSYAATLADYNSKMTGYNLDLNKFNASQRQGAQNDYYTNLQKTSAIDAQGYQNANTALDTQLKQAQLYAAYKALQSSSSSSGSGSGSSGSSSSLAIPSYVGGAPNIFSPGYITDQGPIIPSTGYGPDGYVSSGYNTYGGMQISGH